MNHDNDNSTENTIASATALVLTIAEMCATYRISKNRVFDEMKAGRLVAKRLGGRVLISRNDAEAWWSALPSRQTA